MSILYRNNKDFLPTELQNLFLSVGWKSGKYPEKLSAALMNYNCVFSAWDDNELIGLISSLDDGVMTAYVHYLLVNPKYQGKGIGRELLKMTTSHYKSYLRIVLVSYNYGVEFYKNCGFKVGEDNTVMFLDLKEQM